MLLVVLTYGRNSVRLHLGPRSLCNLKTAWSFFSHSEYLRYIAKNLVSTGCDNQITVLS